MKGIIGAVLFGAGFIAALTTVSKGQSFWYVILSFMIFMYGLELIISDKIEDAKIEMQQEIDDKLENYDFDE